MVGSYIKFMIIFSLSEHIWNCWMYLDKYHCKLNLHVTSIWLPNVDLYNILVQCTRMVSNLEIYICKMTHILEDQEFIMILILYADDKSTICCFGLVLDSSFNFFFKKVLVGPLYHLNCCMEMSNSSNYSLQFSLSAFVCLKKSCFFFENNQIQKAEFYFPFVALQDRHYYSISIGVWTFSLSDGETSQIDILHTHSGDPCRWCQGLPNLSIHRVQATPCSPTSKFNDTKSTYLRQFHTADSQVCISILFHECKYFTNCHCFPGTMCAFIAKYKPCYRPLPQNI